MACSLNDDVSIINPVFIIKNRNTNFNYCYASDKFNRYYFIDKIEVLKAGHLALHCRCDVLKTYADSIMQADIIAERSTSNYNVFMEDTNYDFISAERTYSFARMPFEFDTSETGKKHYIMTIGGK